MYEMRMSSALPRCTTKWIVKEQGREVGYELGSYGSGKRPVAGYCEHGIEFCVPIKVRNLL